MCKGAITLVCGAWQAEILPHFGMNVISLKKGDREILRKPDCFETLYENPHVYGIPLLFPANRTKGGAFEYLGGMYTLPLNEPARGNHIHGLMYDAPFEVIFRSDNTVKAVFENTFERYPFPFRMTITDELSEAGILRILKLENTGESSFPYTLAFHTAFREPETLRVPVKDRFLCDKNYIPTRKHVSLSENERKYPDGIALRDTALSGFYSSGGEKAYLDDICFSVSRNFDEWILFNAGGGQGFVCVEPQAGEVNGLNTRDGCRILRKGETHVFSLSITQEDKA